MLEINDAHACVKGGGGVEGQGGAGGRCQRQGSGSGMASRARRRENKADILVWRLPAPLRAALAAAHLDHGGALSGRAGGALRGGLLCGALAVRPNLRLAPRAVLRRLRACRALLGRRQGGGLCRVRRRLGLVLPVALLRFRALPTRQEFERWWRQEKQNTTA